VSERLEKPYACASMAKGTAEEQWRDLLSGKYTDSGSKSPLRFIPSNPRCRLCLAPFRAPGALILRPLGFTPWAKNPRICGKCFKAMETHAKRCPRPAEGEMVTGAEVEISMLFADVRGSSKIARSMSTTEFSRLMGRFYEVSKQVLFDANAIVEKFVGDEVVGLFIPFMTGPAHAETAIATAQQLLRATGHGDPDGPWLPLGAGVHTGIAFVGIVGTHGSSDFTALGDPMNIAAHISAQAAVGEILVTDESMRSAGRSLDGLERRHLSLKGHPADAVVLSST
jgi:adenylate cyclase